MTLAATHYNSELASAASDYQHWLSEMVVPHWVMNGFTERGGVVERFRTDGHPDLSCNKRIRVQGRQMFAFAYAHNQGWINNGPELIQRIEGFLLSTTDASLPGFYPHALAPNDDIALSHRDLYDCAFFLLAYGWRYHAFHDLKALHCAKGLLAEIERSLKGPGSGWFEGTLPVAVRRQNPHMHLFEAFLTLYQFTHDSRWIAYAGEMFSLFETVFFDGKNQVVREYFDNHWQLDKEQGHIVEPGHMFEWIWLLLQYHKHTQKPVLEYCQVLYRKALEIGTDGNSPLVFDEVHANGNIIKASKRCWPMTEWIKAALAMAKMNEGSYDYEQHAAAALRSLMTHFQNPLHPHQYLDRLDARNQVVEDSAPASTLYHLLMAHAETQEYCNL